LQKIRRVGCNVRVTHLKGQSVVRPKRSMVYCLPKKIHGKEKKTRSLKKKKKRVKKPYIGRGGGGWGGDMLGVLGWARSQKRV